MKSWADDIGAKLDHDIDRRFGVAFPCNVTLNARLFLHRGDITKLERPVGQHLAIVNAARPSLLGGGGIDRTIHQACGVRLKQRCMQFPVVDEQQAARCVHGDAVITPSFALADAGGASHVIHTVGPHRDLHDETQRVPLLRRSYRSCLDLAVNSGIHTIALCCISTGAYRYPSREAAHQALRTVRLWLEEHQTDALQLQVIFCCFLEQDYQIYRELMKRFYFPL